MLEPRRPLGAVRLPGRDAAGVVGARPEPALRLVTGGALTAGGGGPPSFSCAVSGPTQGAGAGGQHRVFTWTRDTRSTHIQMRTHMRIQLNKPDICMV